MQATGNNFLLTFIKDGIAYPVALTDEQREAFNMTLSFIPGEIKVVNEPIGKVVTLGEIKKMKEGCN